MIHPIEKQAINNLKNPFSDGKLGSTQMEDIPMKEGYHHTDNVPKVVEKFLPEAKEVFSMKLNFSEMAKPWFEPFHMEYMAVNLYKM